MKDKINLEGWKGKDKIIISGDFHDNVVIEEHRKNKETGEIKTSIRQIPSKNIKILKRLIVENCKKYEIYGYRFIAKIIINYFSFTVDLEAWNGGKNRAKYYFPFHYYPLKVLEAEGFIKYFGNGNIMRLRDW